MNWRAIQTELIRRGYDLGPAAADGVPGRRTMAAVRSFKVANGLSNTNTVGPQTLAALFPSAPAGADSSADAPWMALLAHKMGLHEKRNRKALAAFLKSDGSTLGDPSKNPWCGDLIETIYGLTLPDEVLPGNPYLARNWVKFGRPDPRPEYSLGATMSFWRGTKAGTNGHVGQPVGINKARTRIRLRGGNQQDQIGDVWIEARRLLASRVPTTWDEPLPPLPILKDTGGRASTNEA